METHDLIPLVGKRVLVDCGDSIHSPFRGAELVGQLRRGMEDTFFLLHDGKLIEFEAQDVVFITEVTD